MACISLLLGRFLGKFILTVLTVISNLLSVCIVLYIYYEVVICNSILNIKLYN